jgi:hypothetical protein
LKQNTGNRAFFIAISMLLMLVAPLTLRAQTVTPSPEDNSSVVETGSDAMLTVPELGVVTGGIYDRNPQSILTNGSQIFAEFRGMGARWIRMQANWRNPSDGSWVTDNTYRAIVEQAHQNGLKVIIVVSGSYTGQVTESAERQWAQNFVCDNAQNNYNCTGDQHNKSLSYLANLVFTGPSRADAYEIINEPNVQEGTPSGFRVGGTTFAWLLREVYLWKERNQRSEYIISGGPLRTWWSSEWAWWGNLLQNWRAFRRDPDNSGTRFRPFDYFGIHPYNEQAIDQKSLEGCNGPYTPAVFNNWKTETINTLSGLRTQLGYATGDSNTQFFATEFAFWLRDPNQYIPPCSQPQGWAYWGMRDATQQADALQAAYEAFRDSGMVVAGLWHEYRDFTDAQSGALARIGLRSSFNGQRYPARQPTWGRFKTLAGGTGDNNPETYWTQVNAPPIPTGLNATPNCASITFSWNSTPGATGYYIDIANTLSDLVNQTGSFRNLGVGGVTSYTWSNLTPNARYYWRIWAYNSYGTHGYPDPAFVYTSTCGGPPPAPTGLVAVPGCTSISFSWNPSPGATGYYVDIANSDSDLRNMTGSFRNHYNGTSTSYNWTGLLSNANYYWRIWAFNNYGGNHGYPSPPYVTTGCGGFGVSYQAYVQGNGWTNWISNGATAGTTGQSLRLEGLKVNLDNPPSGVGICYQAHVQNIGWQGQVCGNNQQIGTPGQGLRMEAVKIWLTNQGARHICYQTHTQNIGWQTEVCDGQIAGTTGQSLRIEAIRIRVTGSGLEPDQELAPSLGPEASTDTSPTLSAEP